jgi:hypothetical protein
MTCYVKWTRTALYIFNGSKRVIYVNPGDGTPIHALDPGATGILNHKRGVASSTPNTQVTLGYYTNTHDLVTILLHDSGTWTTSSTPPDPSSCYTKDRRPAALSLGDATLTQRPPRNSQATALLRDRQY